ncbi:MAG TPA: hypothetical protein VND68_07705 [Chloroflexia bacterium]|jgi:beta propeller repeat protein|nr:hypothetical protein [Chloroflexia bacterium]
MRRNSRHAQVVLRKLAVLLLLGAALPAFAFAAPQGQATGPRASASFTLAGGAGRQLAPSAAGNVVVYSDCATGTCRVRGVKLDNKQAFSISPTAAGQLPSTDGTRVVWMDSRNATDTSTTDRLNNMDVYSAKLDGSGEQVVSKAPNLQSRPRVSGNIAVWSDHRAATSDEDSESGDIYMYDFGTGQETRVSGATSAQIRPATNGKVLVWEDYRNEPDPDGFNSDIYGYDLATKQEFVITNAPDQQSDPAIWGNIVVWSDFRKGEDYNADIYGFDLTTRQEFLITDAPGSQTQPAIDGYLVAWADYRNDPQPGSGNNSDIYGYDLITKREFLIFSGPGVQGGAVVSGNTVAWEDFPSGDVETGESDVKAATVSGVTSAAPGGKTLPPPALLPGRGSRTFPETGKTVSGAFLDYWDKNGGLAQQGFPISEVMGEVSDLNGKAYTVQYFERAVFEYHPENQPPYNVLLSQLGTFQYKKKYPNGAPSQKAQPGGRPFPETGKTVSGRFLEYWQQNGGLAQQGLPLSDPFQEKSDTDGKTYTVQYFERAVFEAHPENPAPYDVLLSLLGTFQYNQKYTP